MVFPPTNSNAAALQQSSSHTGSENTDNNCNNNELLATLKSIINDSLSKFKDEVVDMIETNTAAERVSLGDRESYYEDFEVTEGKGEDQQSSKSDDISSLLGHESNFNNSNLSSGSKRPATDNSGAPIPAKV